jgi:hypothetical protein
MKFVSRYITEICYGGPEEGGWWYDWNTFDKVMAICPEDDDAFSVCKALNIRQQEEDKEAGIDYSSVNCDSYFMYDVENMPAENQTTERPRYE